MSLLVLLRYLFLHLFDIQLYFMYEIIMHLFRAKLPYMTQSSALNYSMHHLDILLHVCSRLESPRPNMNLLYYNWLPSAPLSAQPVRHRT